MAIYQKLEKEGDMRKMCPLPMTTRNRCMFLPRKEQYPIVDFLSEGDPT